MQMGIIPAITHTASEEIVLYALATLMDVSRNILFSFLWFRFVFSATPHAGTPYLNTDDDTRARRRLSLLLGPPTFGIILATRLVTRLGCLLAGVVDVAITV